MSLRRGPRVTIGMIANHLTVVGRCRDAHGRLIWIAQCTCGNTRNMYPANILKAFSCGCKKDEVIGRKNTKHGKSAAPVYACWQSMLARCSRPSAKEWANYGGRGISVCERWQKFENFLADMGEPGEGLQLDRINNDGNYEPGNCRWATPAQNMNNRRVNRHVNVGGQRMTIAEASRALGITRKKIYWRIKDGNVNFEARTELGPVTGLSALVVGTSPTVGT